MNIVFLYTEIAPYFLACCTKLAEIYNVNIHIIRYPVNNEAPFAFSAQQNIYLYNRKDYTFASLNNVIEKINPSIIICSGWIDKEYLRICKRFHPKIQTVLAIDTQWRGDVKQHIATLLSPFLLKNKFSHAWVPGNIQKQYVKKLGFKDDEITLGFYRCDMDYFSSIGNKIIPKKKQNFPKRFIYVGRYFDYKGVDKLWQAFIEWQKENPFLL